MSADPLSEIIAQLRPRTVFAKGVSGAGRWGVRYAAFGHPSFAAVLEGRCRLTIEGAAPIILERGDFVLLPATPAFVMTGFEPATPKRVEPVLRHAPGEEVRHGRQSGPPDVRLLGGYFIVEGPNAPLLMSLSPHLVHVRGAGRLAILSTLLNEEAQSQLAGRDLILNRLVEIMLVEALRSSAHDRTTPSLLRGLADDRIAPSIRALHGDPARAWTLPLLAETAALSRSAYFDRFMRVVGLSPMAYLLSWRMTLAKEMLRRADCAIDTVAEKVGYASASAFSTAFSKHVGQPPKRYARALSASATSTIGD